MYLLSKAGIPNNEVLIIATRNGAIQLGLQDRFGTIEFGKFADLLILEKSPLKNIQNTRTINSVIKEGKTIDRKNLL